MATNVGLVVGNSGAPTTGDASLRVRLETEGFTVTYVDDSAAVPSGFDGFVIAASAVAATVGTQYDALTVPVATLNFDLWDDNRLATDTGAATASSADYDLVTHEITTGLTDPLTVLTSGQAQRGVLATALPTGAAVFARTGADATRAAGWTVRAGAALTSGTAPANRLALFLPDAWLTLLTGPGQVLVERALGQTLRTLTTTYESTLARVKLVASGLGNAVDATFEKSTNLVTWTTVRGGSLTPVVNGVATTYDYEFTPGVVNYYRATSARDAGFVAAGAASHANNASVNPGLPSGARLDDVLVLFAAIRNFEGVPVTPAGYTTVIDLANVRVMRKVHGTTESAPTVTFTGGVANASTSAQLAAFRNVEDFVTAITQQFNSTAQNIAYPALTVAQTRSLILYQGWKQDDWTSVGTLPGDGGVAVEIDESSTTLGDDQGLVWDYTVQATSTPVDVAAGSFLVTGGAAAFSRPIVTVIPATSNVVTGGITPVIDDVWLKSIGSPFLNRAFDCVPNISDVERGERVALFEVLNRSFPVALTDLRQSREFTIELITRTTQEHVDLDFILALGGPMYLQTPPDYPVPSMHVVIGRTVERRPLRSRSCDNDWRVFSLPLREVAAPGADVVGSTITWQGVINFYASWQAVLDGETSWFDLLQNVGTPADVIVA